LKTSQLGLVPILMLATRPAAAHDAKSPTPEEMAPIIIPSAATSQSDFAKRLSLTCEALDSTELRRLVAANAQKLGAKAKGKTDPRPNVPPTLKRLAVEKPPAGPGDAPEPSQTAIDAMVSLHETCQHIETGLKLTDDDVANLKGFREDAAGSHERIGAFLKAGGTQKESSSTAEAVSAGSLEAEIIKGLTKFIYERAKLEGVNYLRGQLVAKLCTDDTKRPHPELPRLLLPATCGAIKTTDAKVALSAMGTYLATAARKDLEQMPDRALAYDLHMVNGAARSETREVLFAGRLALAYYRAVTSGRTPLDVARSMHAIVIPSSVAGHDTKIFQAVRRASHFIDAIAAQDGWSSVTSPTVPRARYYALGVLFSLEEAFTQDKLKPSLNAQVIAAQIPVVAQYLADVVALFNRAKAATQTITAAASATNGDFKGATATASDTGKGLTVRDFTLTATQTLHTMIRGGSALASALKVENSVTAKFENLLSVFELGEALLNHATPSEILVLATDVLMEVRQIAQVANDESASSVLSNLQQFLALVAQIAQAKSADEVASILEAAAVPASTYEVKYEHAMVAVGALAGVSGGFEWVRATGDSWSRAPIMGALAPVGITLSTALSSKWHIGGMLSVIDLGSLVSSRFSEDTKTNEAMTGMTTVKTDPQLKLANVFAPGVFGILGIGGSPLVLTMGGQVVPSAREVVTTLAGGSQTSSTRPAIQLLLGLAVDVPIFAF
jgi:hypothetical protein